MPCTKTTTRHDPGAGVSLRGWLVLTNQRLIHPTLADRIAAEIGLPKRRVYDRCGDCHPVNAEIDQLIDVRIYNDSQLAGFTSETTGAACPLPLHPESGKGAPDRRIVVTPMRRSALSGHPECRRVLERAFCSVRVFPGRRGSSRYGTSARRSTSSRAADRTASRHATCLEAQLVRRPLRSRLLGPRTRPWSPSELLRRPPEHQSDVRATGASPRR